MAAPALSFATREALELLGTSIRAGRLRRRWTIRDLAERVGVARNNSIVEVALLEHVLRDDLDRRSPRVMGVLRPLRVVIETVPEGFVEELEAPYWPAEMGREGSRKTPFSRVLYIERDDFMENPPKDYHRLSPGREVRLRYGFVIKCERVVKDDAGEVIEVVCSHDPLSKGEPTPGGRRVKGTIHWVSAQHAFEAEVRLYDRLFQSEQPAVGDDMIKDLNPESLVTVRAQLEPSLGWAKAGDRFQLERLGFFFVDPVDSKDGAPVFNRTVGLKDSWAKIAKAAAEPSASTPEPKAKQAPKRESVKREKTELTPEAKALVIQYDLGGDEAHMLADDAALRTLFEEAIAAKAPAKAAAKWVTNEVRAITKDTEAKDLRFGGAALAELLSLVEAGDITATIAKEVLEEMKRSGESPKAIVEKKGSRQIVDTAALDAVAQAVLAENGDLAARYKAGNVNLFGALVGAAMKKTGGKANARALQDALRKALG